MPPPREELLKRVRGVHGILSMLSDRIDGEVLDAAGKQLRVVANYAVGFNNIDVPAARTRGVQVGNTPGVLTDATADVAVALLLAVARRLPEGQDQVRQLTWKTWEPLGLLGLDLAGKTLGIVGMGRIGQAVARRLKGGWQMRVIYTARSPKWEAEQELAATRVDFDQLLAESDIISLHADYNPTTHHLINAVALQKMKKSSILINTARGGLVQQDDLYAALKSGQIFGAGLDVTDPEPLPVECRLRELANCLILPHIGSSTVATREAMSDIAAQNLLAGLRGEPIPFAVPGSVG